MEDTEFSETTFKNFIKMKMMQEVISTLTLKNKEKIMSKSEMEKYIDPIKLNSAICEMYDICKEEGSLNEIYKVESAVFKDFLCKHITINYK